MVKGPYRIKVGGFLNNDWSKEVKPILATFSYLGTIIHCKYFENSRQSMDKVQKYLQNCHLVSLYPEVQVCFFLFSTCTGCLKKNFMDF